MNNYSIMKRFCCKTSVFLMLTMIMSCLSVQATEISVDVSRNPVNLNESVDISFHANGATDGDPDFSPLQNDFDILNQSTNSQVSISNGSVSRNYQWTVTVIPKQIGGLIIPSIAFGSDTSPASVLQVNEKPRDMSTQSSEDVFLEVDASPSDPYVQAQVVYTVRVFHRVGITQAGLSEPKIDNAVVEPLQKDTKYRTQRGEHVYDVFERRYTIFPQSSGTIVIAPTRLDAQVVTGRSSGGFFSRNTTRAERFVSKPVELNVKPIPNEFKGKHWLPASSMELSQSWSENPTTAAIGEPVTQTMTLQAEGLMKSQLPTLSELQKDSLISSEIKIYPDQPVLTQAGSPNGVISRREEKMAMIPSKSGNFKLPAIEIPWWNTNTDRMEIARLDGTHMKVNESLKKTDFPSDIESPVGIASDEANSTIFNISNDEHSNDTIWKWVAFGLGFGWLFTLIALIYFINHQKHKAIGDPSIGTTETNERRSRAGRNLRLACRDNRSTDARTELLNWAQARWPDNPPTNLTEIGKRIPALYSGIDQLQQSLYNTNVSQWDGQVFWELFKAHRRDKDDQLSHEGPQLEPLFKA